MITFFASYFTWMVWACIISFNLPMVVEAINGKVEALQKNIVDIQNSVGKDSHPAGPTEGR